MKNAYESGNQKVIPAVLLYAFYESRVLMLHRNSKPNDLHEGKWNGLGGKLEFGESPLQTAVREFKEESRGETTAEQWRWAGQLFFPNFRAAKNEDWWVTVYTTELTAAQVASIPIDEVISPEGSLRWIARSELLNLNLWDGDRHFLPHVLAQAPFEGTFFYEQGSCRNFTLRLIS
jgi:8-oxo-dGTP diphosphatase